MENPEALRFHQETMKESKQQTKMMEKSTKTSGLVLYKTLHYFSTKLASFYLYASGNVISTKHYFQNRGNYYKFQLQNSNHRHYLNVSTNIII